MKKKIFIYSDDLQGFGHGSAMGNIMKEIQEKEMWEREQPKQWAISGSYAITSSYQYTPISISGSFLPPWTDDAGKPLTASWVPEASTPFTPYATPQKDYMKTLKESLDFLYTTNIDLKEQVVELKDELSNLKYNSAGFLVGKDGAELELAVVKTQLDAALGNLKIEKTNAINDINTWKSRFDASESNHKFAVNHCTELNKTIRMAKDECQRLRDEVKTLKDSKVNDEQLARQLLVKVKELEIADKELDSLIRENEKYKDQSCRLINENAKLSCPGMYLPEVKKCGKCVSCQLEQANRVRQELADHLAATKKESNGYAEQMNILRIERDAFADGCAQHKITISQMEATNKKLYIESVASNASKTKDIDHLRHIITILTRGLINVINGGVFKRKDIAKQARENMTSYVLRNKLENMQICAPETIKE